MDLKPHVLWRLLKAELSRQDIDEIANSDYGSDFEANCEALSRIVETGVVPAPLEWVPKEALELTKWGGEGAQAPSEFIQALFSCVVLIGAECDPQSEVEFPQNEVIVAVHSSFCLHGPWAAGLLEFLGRVYHELCRQAEAGRWLGAEERLCHPLACLILSALENGPAAERGHWRAEIRKQMAWYRAADPAMGLHHDPWHFFDRCLTWSLWRRYLSLTRRDVAGFSPQL